MIAVAPTARLQERLLRLSTPVEMGYVTPCWIWLGRVAAGYGRISIRRPGKKHAMTALAHRVSYAVFIEPYIPRKHDLHHLCNVTACINPNHLEIVPNTRHPRIHDAHF